MTRKRLMISKDNYFTKPVNRVILEHKADHPITQNIRRLIHKM